MNETSALTSPRRARRCRDYPTRAGTVFECTSAEVAGAGAGAEAKAEAGIEIRGRYLEISSIAPGIYYTGETDVRCRRRGAGAGETQEEIGVTSARITSCAT